MELQPARDSFIIGIVGIVLSYVRVATRYPLYSCLYYRCCIIIVVIVIIVVVDFHFRLMGRELSIYIIATVVIMCCWHVCHSGPFCPGCPINERVMPDFP